MSVVGGSPRHGSERQRPAPVSQALPPDEPYDYQETVESVSTATTQGDTDGTASSVSDDGILRRPADTVAWAEKQWSSFEKAEHRAHSSARAAMHGIPTEDDLPPTLSSQSSAGSVDSETEAAAVGELTAQYNAEIAANEAAVGEMAAILTTLIDTGRMLQQEASGRQGAGGAVKLTHQQLEMVAMCVVKVLENQGRRVDPKLRQTIGAVHVKYAAADAAAFRVELMEEVSDLLYDEMIFSQVCAPLSHPPPLSYPSLNMVRCMECEDTIVPSQVLHHVERSYDHEIEQLE
jgi:hypothetical protein